jgi:ADP-heptose:LPS heptosyltransferase
VVICPFAGGTFEKLDKTWPAFHEFTAALLPRLQAKGQKIVACPGPGEEPIILSQHQGVCMLPQLKLDDYNALLQRAHLVVSNDTGPGHMAAAVGAPVLSVLGPTKPEQWAPWGPQVKYLRHWPRWPTAEEVLEETLKQLTRSAPATPGAEPASPAA